MVPAVLPGGRCISGDLDLWWLLPRPEPFKVRAIAVVEIVGGFGLLPHRGGSLGWNKSRCCSGGALNLFASGDDLRGSMRRRSSVR